MFPSREEKAAKLGYELAAKRVFGADGARMAMAVTLVFLEANGLSVDAPQDEVVVTARALVNRRLRYDDLRRNAMELLMKQSDVDLTDTIRRLLASSKAPMRMAGLDMVTQLHQSEDRGAVADACMDAVEAIAKPTSQEKILIDALMPKQEKTEEPQFTEADRYVPVVEIDDYAMECIRTFMEIFPQSKLEKQVLEGKPVKHNGIKLPVLPCAAAKKAQQHLRSLSDFVTAHEKETYEDRIWEKEVPIGSHIHNFYVF